MEQDTRDQKERRNRILSKKKKQGQSRNRNNTSFYKNKMQTKDQDNRVMDEEEKQDTRNQKTGLKYEYADYLMK